MEEEINIEKKSDDSNIINGSKISEPWKEFDN